MSCELLALAASHPDEELPIEIHSDSAQFDDKKGTATYLGNVVMQQGSRQLSSQSLIIKRDNHGKIESMVAKGTPATFQAKPSPEKPLIHGFANIIQFYPNQDKMILLENASLTQNEDTLEGDSLTYFVSKHILSSDPVPGKRTTVLITPKPKSTDLP